MHSLYKLILEFANRKMINLKTVGFAGLIFIVNLCFYKKI
jgi:hypothetical protein